MGSDPNKVGVFGGRQVDSGHSEYNAMAFIVKQLLSRVNTAELVQVKAVYAAGVVAPVGVVDVQPLVNQVDGIGQPTPHGTIFSLPYVRIQGGINALIIDPEVGDIGLCVFCAHDISAVKASSAISNPGSRRRFDMADGVYIGGWLNKVSPSRYIQVGPSGINIIAPDLVKMEAPTAQFNIDTLTITASELVHIVSPLVTIDSPVITMNGNLFVNGLIACSGGSAGGQSTFTGSFKLTGDMEVTDDIMVDGISSKTHTHGGVQSGTSSTGEPEP